MKSNIRLKPSALGDFDDYYAIRCGESDIYWMGFDGPPERMVMEKVFKERLGNNRFAQPGDKRIYMIQVDERNVGFIQFSLSNEGLEFGYSVLDQERGKGYGSAGIKQAVDIAKLCCDHCFAQIRDDNIASQKAMGRAGFKRTDSFIVKDFPHAKNVKYRKYILE